MNKCFITKLPSSVDNDNLPVLGQLRINWLKQSNLANNDQRYVKLATTDSITVNVSGAHFTDKTLSSNLGNTKTITAADGNVELYVSNDSDAVMTIDNKYSLTCLNFVHDENHNLIRSVYFDVDNIKYCTNINTLGLSRTQISGDINFVNKFANLEYLALVNTQVSGDISAINKFNLNYLRLSNTQVSGDINAISNSTNLDYLDLNNTKVSGDISQLSKLTNLRFCYLTKTQISGNISALNKLTKLIFINMSNTNVSGDLSGISNLTNITDLRLDNTQVSGDVSSLANLTKLSYLELNISSLTGDMSKIPAKINFIFQSNRKVDTNFTWTANGRKNVTLLAMQGNIPFDTTSMDNMFIDQATCTFAPFDYVPESKIISVKGTRTLASDAAVEAIQNKGITIIGVTKQA